MFAGKTEELLRRVRRARVAGVRVEVVSHALDVRRGVGRVSTHDGVGVPARVAQDVSALVLGRDPRARLLAIDEAQFFGPELVGAVGRLADAGLVVVVAGLDVTYDGRPFDPVASLAALAERSDRLLAVCTVCGRDAPFHERVAAPGDDEDARLPTPAHVGGAESYQARCREHFGAASWRV